MLYISCASSFISSQFLALPLDGWFGVLFKKLIIDVPLLYYFINIRSSIIFCFSLEDIYLSWGISLSCSFVSVSELFCSKSLSAILLTIKSPVAFAGFFHCFFWGSFKCICCKLLGMIKKFLDVLPLKFLLVWLRIFLPIYFAKDKNLNLLQNFDLLVELNST